MNATIDDSLRTFYREEMPMALPPCPFPATSLLPQTRAEKSWLAVAMAIAAGVILMLSLSFAPNGQMKQEAAYDPFGSATAKGKVMNEISKGVVINK